MLHDVYTVKLFLQSCSETENFIYDNDIIIIKAGWFTCAFACVFFKQSTKSR